MGPELIQHPLRRADGSITSSDALYTVIAGVNGPVEVQRRDELPEEAAIEVNIRPVTGVGGPKERWAETVLHSVLKSIVLVHMHPRTLIQVTLQVTKEPSSKLRRMHGDIAAIPVLLNTAFIALVDSGLPLATTMTAVLAVVNDVADLILNPQEKEVVGCKSIHAMAYNAHGEQLLDQSSGSFNPETWEKVAGEAQQACVAAMANVEDAAMADDEAQPEPWLRKTLEAQARAASAWRDDT